MSTFGQGNGDALEARVKEIIGNELGVRSQKVT